MKPIIIIPVRLKSTRLPEKPLQDICGKPMIQHVWEQAVSAQLGPVVVACDSEPVKSIIQNLGGTAVMTDPDLPSGSDRIYAALKSFDSDHQFNTIINLQGDLPNFPPKLLKETLPPLEESTVDIVTMATEIKSTEERDNPNVVKVVLAKNTERRSGRALYFSRHPIPSGPGPHYHHVGIYTYRRTALERFIKLDPSPLEIQERLEQLRALEASMRIDAILIDQAPWGVDTPEDLERMRTLLKASN